MHTTKFSCLAQAMAYLGKADELLRWSAELRGMQLPQLPASLINSWQPAGKQGRSSAAASASRTESEHSGRPGKESMGSQQVDIMSESLGSETAERRDLQQNDAEGSSWDSTASDEQSPSAAARASQGCGKGTAEQRERRGPASEDAESAEHAAADDHAQHLWSSWLRWQHK